MMAPAYEAGDGAEKQALLRRYAAALAQLCVKTMLGPLPAQRSAPAIALRGFLCRC